jgi:hypothetical protein
MREIEQDGFITDEIYIQETKPLERVDMDRAIPAKGCKYPKCEECRDYRNGYCTVPIVVTKQMWLMKGDTTDALIKDVSELREMVYDEILGKKSEAETGNYSFSNTNGRSICFNCEQYDLKGWCKRIDQAVSPNSYCIKGVFKP